MDVEIRRRRFLRRPKRLPGKEPGLVRPLRGHRQLRSRRAAAASERGPRDGQPQLLQRRGLRRSLLHVDELRVPRVRRIRRRIESAASGQPFRPHLHQSLQRLPLAV